MKRFFFPIVAMIFALISTTSCSDDDSDFRGEVVIPNESEPDMMTVDAWSSDYAMNIKSEGAWTIKTTDRFIKLNPAAGTGDATVTVTVQDNKSDKRKYGNLAITFEGHPELDKDIVVEQKYAGDYDENQASKVDDSNRIYGVGYSYDATGEWGTLKSVKNEIFDTKTLINEGKLTKGPVQLEIRSTFVSGSSIAELSNDLATEAHISGGFGKFKAEANASFDMKLAKNSNAEFASTYYDISVYTASCETGLEMLRSDYMLDDAWCAINGYPRKDKREYMRVDYPTESGLKNLIKAYGTHVVLGAKLGGRVRHTMSVDISKVSKSYDIKAFASASYDGLLVKGGASVDNKYKQSFKDTKTGIEIRLTVLGGDANKAKALQDTITKENLNAWVESVNDTKMTLVSLEEVVPLWELVDETLNEVIVDPKDPNKKYVVNGKERKEKLKKYMEEGIIEDEELSSYDCGTVTEFIVPDFARASYDLTSSLVKTVKIGGQIVAYVCNEYIPNINHDERVTVIYPAKNNAPCFNMGFFTGSYGHRPARVSWDGTNVAVQEYPDMDFGEATELYLRGATIYPELPEGTQAHAGITDDFVLEGMSYDWYTTVKIFNNIWTREDYRGTNPRTGGNVDFQFVTHYPKGTNETHLLYPLFTVKKDYFTPLGWRVPTSEDYKAIEKKLKDNAVDRPGRAFWSRGILGYDAFLPGWWDRDHQVIVETADQADYLTLDGQHARIRKDGIYTVEKWFDDAPLPIRLIKQF